jgi:hypothetical protein
LLDEELTDLILNNKPELIAPINFWSPLLDRLNIICIAIHFTLFYNTIDPEKDKKMNQLWRTFFENVKLINMQVKNHRLDPNKVSPSQERNLKLHKKFFMFWFKELIPKMGPKTELEDMLTFLRNNFVKIYGNGDVRWLLKLSQQNKITNSRKNIQTRQVSESVNVKSLKPKPSKMTQSFDFAENTESLKRRKSEGGTRHGDFKQPRSSQEETPERKSMLISASVLNKFTTPAKPDLKMVEEEQSIPTDSEMEQFQKTISDFKSKKPTKEKEQVFGEALNLKRNETVYSGTK